MKSFLSHSRFFLILLTVLCNGVDFALADTPQDFSAWRFYADAIVQPQADDCFEAVYVDFTRLLQRDLKQAGTLDEASLCVAPVEDGRPGAPVPVRFVKDNRYDAQRNARGTLVFLVKGTVQPELRSYRVFFDTLPGKQKPLPESEVEAPAAANLVWNGSFEILSQDYRGTNRYHNVGRNMPQGWWGNLRGGRIPENLATQAHSGRHALAFVAPEEGKSISVMGAPTPVALRVFPGQSYEFSFWAAGEGLNVASHILVASIYWYDRDQKFLSRVPIDNLPRKRSGFSWTQGSITLSAPTDAHYGALRVGTYSATGLIFIDDFEARLVVPPLLKNAKLNRS